MDLLSCKSGSRCPTCHHFVAGGCELEALLATTFSWRAPPSGRVRLDAFDSPRAGVAGEPFREPAVC